MNYATATTFNTHKKFLALLIVVSLCAMALYVYFMVSAVYQTALRQELADKISNKVLAVSDLESSYLDAKKGITAETVSELGFKQSVVKAYVTKKAEGVAFQTSR